MNFLIEDLGNGSDILILSSLGTDDKSLQTVRRFRGFPWLPSEQQAAYEWTKLKDDIKNNRIESVNWNTNWFKGLQKKYRIDKKYAKVSPFGSGEPKLVLGGYLDCQSNRVRTLIIRRLRELGCHKLPNGLLIPIFKKVGELALHHGDDLFDGYYMEISNLNNFFGAEEESEEVLKEFEKQVENWIFSEKEEDKAGSEREEVIFSGLDILFKSIGKCEQGQKIDDWLLDTDKWVTGGASTESGIKGARKTKSSTVAAHDQQWLKAQLYDKSDVKYKMLIKRERTKLRNLVTAPFSLHMQMSFLGEKLEEHLWKHIPTSLEKNFGIGNWMGWQQEMNKNIFMPIDQSKFDHIPSGRVLEKIFSLIVEACVNAGDIERAEIGKILLSRLKRGNIEFNGRIWRHLRGILSGWRWTTVIGTVLNAGMYLGLCYKFGLPIASKRNTAHQGDDLLAAVASWDAAAVTVKKYMDIFPVNPSKFFLDKNRAEYLRLVLFREGHSKWRRRGYPARAFMSLLYANAWSSGTKTASSLVAGWSKFAGRLNDGTKAYWHCIRDLCGLLRCSKSDAIAVISTPKTNGGLGYIGVDKTKKKVGIIEPEVERRSGRLVRTTNYSEASDEIKRQVFENRLSFYGGDQVAAQASSVNMISRLTGLKQQTIVLSQIAPAKDVFIGVEELRRGTQLPPVPPTKVPRSVFGRICVENRRDFDLMASYLEDSIDIPFFKQQYDRLPRWLFLDWVSGTFSVQSASCWGAAEDVTIHVKRMVRREYKVIPRGRVKSEVVKKRMAFFELISRTKYTKRLLSFGA